MAKKKPKKSKKVKKPVKFLKLEVHKALPHDRYFLQGMSPAKHARSLISHERKLALKRLDQLALRFRELDQQDHMIEILEQYRVGDGAWITPHRDMLVDSNWYIVRETHHDDKRDERVMTGPIRIARWREQTGWEDQGMVPTHAGLVMFIPNPKVRLDELPGEEKA